MKQKFWVPGKFEETLKDKNVTSQVMMLYIYLEEKKNQICNSDRTGNFVRIPLFREE